MNTVTKKTSDLTDDALDWAAATCEHFTLTTDGISMLLERGTELRILGANSSSLSYSPSTNWAQGGPIVERDIEELQREADGTFWAATPTHSARGATPLIAAMRCYVASRLCDKIDVPEQLLARKAAAPNTSTARSLAKTSLAADPLLDEDAEDDAPSRPGG